MKPIVAVAIALTVGIVTFSGVLIPAIESGVDTQDTFTNTGLWRMKEIENGDEWTRNSSTGWAYGDTDIVLPSGQSGSNVMLGDDWCIRYVGHLRSTIDVNKSTNLNNATVIAGEELIVASKTDSTWTANLDYPGYGADPNGDYVMTQFDTASYVKGDTAIYGTGVSTIEDVQIFVHIEATVDDGATFTISQSTGQVPITDVVLSNVSVNYSEVAGYDDLYKLTSVTCDISFNATIEDVSTPKEGSITFSSYIVPYEVTAEKSIHADASTILLFQTIPVFIVLGMIVAVVGVLYMKTRR